MIARNALYDFLQDVIDNSISSDALYGAIPFRNLKSDVSSAEKVVRVEVIVGTMVVSNETIDQEKGVRFTVQFWVLPDQEDGADEGNIDIATDTSFDMARQFFDAVHEDESLGGRICQAIIPENDSNFETGRSNLGATVRGVTFLDGDINPVNQG